jgi:DNA-3-methyladenine glycosylase II
MDAENIAEHIEENIWLAGEEFLKKADARLIPLIEKYGHCTLKPTPPEKYYLALIKSLLLREMYTIDAQAAIRAIERKFGGAPRAEDLAATEFVGLHIPGQAREKVKDLSAKILDGTVPIGQFPAMADSAIVSCLREVHGIERWTAEMFLVLVMARPNVFPAKDRVLQIELQMLYGLDDRPKNSRAEAPLTALWSPWRTLAVWYLWQDYNSKQPEKKKVLGEKIRPAASGGEKPKKKKKKPGRYVPPEFRSKKPKPKKKKPPKAAAAATVKPAARPAVKPAPKAAGTSTVPAKSGVWTRVWRAEE